MNLNDYQWSLNPRGMHNKGAAQPVNAPHMASMKLGWVKLVCSDREYLNTIPQFLASNITPIVRLWRPHFGAGGISSDMIFAWKAYLSAGVRWFEFYNEPNQSGEWPDGGTYTYTDIPGTIGPLMTTWLNWAELIISLGGYPAFPALTESADAIDSTALWMDAMLGYLRDNYLDRMRTVIGSGLWCAVHAVTFNHFYQEAGSPNLPRPPEQENGSEGGWHFEYPYDPICQADDPGRTFYGGTPLSPFGDPNGLTVTGAAFMSRLNDWFGGNIVPVVSTEGGIEPVPTGGTEQPDSRYPAYTPTSHGEATLAMFNYIAQVAPPWYFGLCLWKDDLYFEGPLGTLPAATKLMNTTPVYKSVPPLATLGDKPEQGDTIIRPGPGPVHGTPDYHFIYLDPDFNAEWFFFAARDYWDKFRAVILTSLDYLAYIPRAKSAAMILLTTSDNADKAILAVKGRFFHVQVDMISVDKVEDLMSILQARVASGKQYSTSK